MHSTEKPGIILAPYGTLSPPALATYSRIAQTYESEFPGSPVRLAFISPFIRRKLKERGGSCYPGLLEALKQMRDLECENVVVQSLEVVPGEEFHQIAALVHGLRGCGKLGFSRLDTGLPLLCGLLDCRAVSSLLPALLRQPAGGAATAGRAASIQEEPRQGEHSEPWPEEGAVVLVGHGTRHPADAIYSLLGQVLRDEHGNVFLANIEGYFSLERIFPALKITRAGAVRLMPFLLVAGGHAENDIFGSGNQSIKSLLEKEGYVVYDDKRGLGDCPEIVSLFVGHTRDALKRLEDQQPACNGREG
jgi:sirohydrochlorin cobaltochelatase